MTSPENSPTTALELNHRLSTLVDRYIDWFQALTVQPDSMIDRANRRMKYRSYQETVELPVMSALDHFRLVTKSVETLRGALPFAHATPLRTAITAAATAVWAMADDEDTRLKRAAVLSFHDAENARKYVNGRPVEKVAGIDEAQSALRRRSAYFADMALEFGEDVRRDRWRPTADFAMVEAASKGMPEWSDGWSPRTEVPSQWRLLSCYAHGMGWATARHVEYGEPDEIGLAKSTLVFDLDDLMSSASIVRLLIERALDRYREMAGYPESMNAELTKILHESMNPPREK